MKDYQFRKNQFYVKAALYLRKENLASKIKWLINKYMKESSNKTSKGFQKYRLLKRSEDDEIYIQSMTTISKSKILSAKTKQQQCNLEKEKLQFEREKFEHQKCIDLENKSLELEKYKLELEYKMKLELSVKELELKYKYNVNK
ncbi:hypothetical protein C2G38_2284412 [Gigaspora rosea]|uniref:Uncharacterized protein n=1 Tax=Gigaspora rosea TaxID=44941 RepID=A0A397U228_9GLOM|nr:hypothetical protein C2G38_2284412 [Gigaspora rosea]